MRNSSAGAPKSHLTIGGGNSPVEIEIAERLREVRGRVAAAARRSGRGAEAVTLVLASKTQPIEALRAAYAAGAREFGENYVKEGALKRQAAAAHGLAGIRWHLIGHLQTNKARLAAANFDLIQSVDSLRIGLALAHARATPIPALVEVNLGGEASKSGCAPEAAESLIDGLRGALAIAGLMTIPPALSPAGAQRHFARLRELRDRLARVCGLALSELSMGMSGDFEIAIEEGATMVRVGRAVFGERSR